MLNELDYDKKQRLIDLLLECPSIKDKKDRDLLIQELPSDMFNAIKGNDKNRMHLLNIVNTCMYYDDGFEYLFEILKDFDGETIPFKTMVDEFIIPEIEITVRLMEHNQAYVAAIQEWEKIRVLVPDTSLVSFEIQRLNEKNEQINRVAEFKKQLSDRQLDIKKIYVQVASRLKRIEKMGIDEEAEVMLDMVEIFLTHKISAQDFIELWAGSLETPPQQKINAPNYQALASRLQHGEIVVFLGLDLLSLCDQTLPNTDTLVSQLAKDVKCVDFNGSLPKIGEYMQVNNQLGKGTLCRKLKELIEPCHFVSIKLYQLLANIDIPMLLITATYDTLLEQTFRQQPQKKFVVLYHSIKEIGKVFFEYSDKEKIQSCSVEELSGFSFLEQGYSVIYKILGHFGFTGASVQQDALIVSESDYFMFTQYQDKLIPKYIVTQLMDRGFWLLGHYPKSWEKRLIIKEFLKQGLRKEQALTVLENVDEFASLFLKNKQVENYPIDLKDFVENLQKHL